MRGWWQRKRSYSHHSRGKRHLPPDYDQSNNRVSITGQKEVMMEEMIELVSEYLEPYNTLLTTYKDNQRNN